MEQPPCNENKFDDFMLSRFDIDHECDKRTDRQKCSEPTSLIHACCLTTDWKPKKIAFQIKADAPQTGYTYTLLCFCDLDLLSITLTYKFHIRIAMTWRFWKIYLPAYQIWTFYVKVFKQTHTDTQTDATEHTTTPHSRTVKRTTKELKKVYF